MLLVSNPCIKRSCNQPNKKRSGKNVIINNKLSEKIIVAPFSTYCDICDIRICITYLSCDSLQLPWAASEVSRPWRGRWNTCQTWLWLGRHWPFEEIKQEEMSKICKWWVLRNIDLYKELTSDNFWINMTRQRFQWLNGLLCNYCY